MKEYAIKHKHLNIKLSAPVKKYLEIKDILVILIYPSDDQLLLYPREKLNRNVYAFKESNGELLWQIQPANEGGASEDKPFMDIFISQGKLIVGNWIGIDYQIDLSNGHINPIDRNKRPW
jgi:hypothetical protein